MCVYVAPWLSRGARFGVAAPLESWRVLSRSALCRAFLRPLAGTLTSLSLSSRSVCVCMCGWLCLVCVCVALADLPTHTYTGLGGGQCVRRPKWGVLVLALERERALSLADQSGGVLVLALERARRCLLVASAFADQSGGFGFRARAHRMAASAAFSGGGGEGRRGWVDLGKSKTTFLRLLTCVRLMWFFY